MPRMLICFNFHIEYIYIYIYLCVLKHHSLVECIEPPKEHIRFVDICQSSNCVQSLFTFFTCSIVLVKSIPRRFGSCSILFLQHSGLRRLVEHARVQEELELGLRDLADRSRGVTSVSCMGASVVPNSIWIPMIHGECKKD